MEQVHDGVMRHCAKAARMAFSFAPLSPLVFTFDAAIRRFSLVGVTLHDSDGAMEELREASPAVPSSPFVLVALISPR